MSEATFLHVFLSLDAPTVLPESHFLDFIWQYANFTPSSRYKSSLTTLLTLPYTFFCLRQANAWKRRTTWTSWWDWKKQEKATKQNGSALLLETTELFPTKQGSQKLNQFPGKSLRYSEEHQQYLIWGCLRHHICFFTLSRPSKMFVAINTLMHSFPFTALSCK